MCDAIFTGKASTNSKDSFASGNERIEQQMKMKQEKQMTDSDANELTSVLRNMKAMAIDINQEQELQNEQLDRLTMSVQKADTKIREDNRTIKKML